MGYVIYLTLVAAQIDQGKLDMAYGWPKVGKGSCQRVHVGGGVHVDHPLCCTTHKCELVKHPSLNQWALSVPEQANKDVLGNVTVVQLDATWASLSLGV